MRIFDTARGLTISAIIAGGIYAFPWGLASLSPGLDEAMLVVEQDAPRQAVYVEFALPPPAPAAAASTPPPAAPPPVPDVPEVDEAPAVDEPADDEAPIPEAPSPEAPSPEATAGHDDVGAHKGPEGVGDTKGTRTPRMPPVHKVYVLTRPPEGTGGGGAVKAASARDTDGRDQASPRAERNPQKRASSSKRRTQTCDDTEYPQIRKVSDTRYDVERDFVDHYSKNLDEAAKLAWVGWHKDDAGKIDGFRVRRIKCGSVLHQVGFRNGDVVHRINGKDVTNIPQALAAYRKLRKKRTLKVELTRRDGSLMVIKYRLS